MKSNTSPAVLALSLLTRLTAAVALVAALSGCQSGTTWLSGKSRLEKEVAAQAANDPFPTAAQSGVAMATDE